MKTKVASLLVVLLLTTAQLMAQKRIIVEAQNYDISYNLDLKAVASIFGDSRNLEEFEMKLNDYDSQISNLDLNNDGEVDYLRVIESHENNVHVVVIQAVLGRDIFQDVATIVVERDRNRKIYVQIIGDPYMYGHNYIIEPVYYRTPFIYSYFWGRNYRAWHSPYYWGYYPTYYRYRNPFEINIYLSNVNRRVNHRHNYRYSDSRRNDYSLKLQSSISRNDYGRSYPDRTFNKRNDNYRNKKEIEIRSNTNTRPSSTRSESGRRPVQGVETPRGTRSTNPTWNGGGTIQRNRTAPSGNRNTEVKRETSPGRVNQSAEPARRQNTAPVNTRGTETNKRNVAPTPSSNRNESRPAPSVNRQNNNTNRVAPSVNRQNNNTDRVAPSENKSVRVRESKPVERKAPESRPARETKSEKRSSDTKSNRR
jgi:hypothetical protein